MTENRRPVKSRSVQAFHHLAAFLVRRGLTPNQVSVLSAVFAILGGVSLTLGAQSSSPAVMITGLGGAFLGIQLRLVCNLVDGLMAVEGGKKTPYGEFFNDFPDRISDIALFISAGAAIQPATDTAMMPWAWAAALLAVLTAYIRVLGGSMGAPQFFLGPMAKQHRMAVLNLGLVGSAVEVFLTGRFVISLQVVLVVVTLGCLVTCARRSLAVIRFFSDPETGNRPKV